MPEIDKLNFVMGMNTQGMARGGTAITRVFGKMDVKFKAVLGTVGLLTAVFLGFTAKAIKAASKFEDSWNEVRTLLDETKTDSEALREEVLRLSAAVGRPPEEVSRGLYQVISAGVMDTADAMFVLEVATKASIAGLTDQFTAVDAITTVMNAWGLEVKDTTKIADIMFNAVKEGKLTFNDLASNIGQVASTAALAKVSFEEVTAALATMTKAGLSMEESTTALNQLLLQTIKAQDEAKVTAREFGFELSSTALAAKGLVGLMNDIATATEGDIDALISLMPNIRAFRGAAILAGTGVDEFNRILKTTETALGASEEAFRKMKESTSEMAKELSTKVEVAFIRFGTKILPLVNAGLESITKLFERITDTEADKILKAIKEIEGVSVLSAQVILRDKINRILEDQRELQKDIAMQQQFGAKALLSTLGLWERNARQSIFTLNTTTAMAEQLAITMKQTNAIVLLEEKRAKFVEEIKVAEIAVALGFVDQNKIGKRALKILTDRRDAMKISLKLLDAALKPLKEQAENDALILKLETEIGRLRKEGVKDTKEIAENLGEAASTDLKLDLTVAFTNIGRAADAVGNLGRELGALSVNSAGALVQVGSLTDGIAEFRSISAKTGSSLFDKLIPGMAIAASGLSILNTIFGKTEKRTRAVSNSANILADKMRKLNEAFERSINLRDISARQELQERLQRLLSAGDLAGIPEDVLRAFVEGVDFKDIFPPELLRTQAFQNIVNLLRDIGVEGAQAFLNFQDIVRAALEDGIITPEEAQAIDDAIRKMAEFPNLMSQFSDETLDAIVAIENLTDRIRTLADEADEAFIDAFETLLKEGTKQELFTALRELGLTAAQIASIAGAEDLAAAMEALLALQQDIADDENAEQIIQLIRRMIEIMFGIEEVSRQAKDIAVRRERDRDTIFPRNQREGREEGGGILDPFINPDTTSVRQFVGITELQSNLIIGILNTSRAIQQEILNVISERLGEGGKGDDIGTINEILADDIENAGRGEGVLL